MIEIDQLCMRYGENEATVDVLKGLDLTIPSSQRVAITGPSGCGKTTLLLLLSALERPTSGRIVLDDVELGALDSDALADLRRDRIGIVFQSFHLVPSLSAIDNVALPLEIAGRRDARHQAGAMLEAVGLAARERHFPSQLSGGEQQRVAIARALVHRPALVLADEPTGNLDDHTGGLVSQLLFDLIEQASSTLVLVTHDNELAARCDRILQLHDGHMTETTAAKGAS